MGLPSANSIELFELARHHPIHIDIGKNRLLYCIEKMLDNSIIINTEPKTLWHVLFLL